MYSVDIAEARKVKNTLNDKKCLADALHRMEKEHEDYIRKCEKQNISPKPLDKSLQAIRWYILTNDYAWNQLTHIERDAVDIVFLIRHCLYKQETDKGWRGSESEVRERLNLWKQSDERFTTWSEFSIHKASRVDIPAKYAGFDIEEKTGVAGADIMRGKLPSFKRTVANYKRRKELIHFHNKEYGFDILTTWAKFFDYLEVYNDKGLATWFDFTPHKKTAGGLYTFKMQVIRTSKAKIEYLKNFTED